MNGEMILQCPYCAEKDAEIERLKEELELERHISGSADAHIGELRKLITEKDAEIERLKRRNAQLEQWNLMTDEQVVMDLKAEIERLKAANSKGQEYSQDVFDENQRLKQIITELADALEKWADWNTFNPGEINRLIQRAREATR